jgi:hypothetical protein
MAVSSRNAERIILLEKYLADWDAIKVLIYRQIQFAVDLELGSHVVKELGETLAKFENKPWGITAELDKLKGKRE